MNRYAHQLPFQVENYILNVKHEHTSWGARKIRERLTRRFSDIKIAAKSTIHAVLTGAELNRLITMIAQEPAIRGMRVCDLRASLGLKGNVHIADGPSESKTTWNTCWNFIRSRRSQ